MIQNPWAEDVRSKLLAKYGYSDRRIKDVAKMTTWGFGPPLRYHSSCRVVVSIRPDGDLDVRVVGDAPLDTVVNEAVTAAGGTAHEFSRGLAESTGRRLEFSVASATCGHILAIAAALDGLPRRHAFERDHYFYTAPEAAKLLRELHAVLTSTP